MTITERVMYGWEMSAIATYITKGGKRTITASEYEPPIYKYYFQLQILTSYGFTSDSTHNLTDKGQRF